MRIQKTPETMSGEGKSMERGWEIQKIIEDPAAITQDQQLANQFKKGADLDYVRFYAERQNRIIESDPETWEKVDRKFQFDFLRQGILRKTDRFLDYGCGTASAGKYIIEYLDPQKYVGVDISKNSIETGWEILVRNGMYRKGPVLLHIADGNLDAIDGLVFDVIWAQSVFTHCPPDTIVDILTGLKRHLHRRARFLATFARVERGIFQKQMHNWYYDLDFFRRVAPECGLDFSVMEGWSHPYDYTNKGFSQDTLLQFTLA